MSVVDGEGSPVFSEGNFAVISPSMEPVVRTFRRLSIPERRASDMMSLAEFVAVLSLVIAAFALGYQIGRDKRNDTKKTKK